MATASFNKDFAITKRETVQKLERGILNSKPIKINSKDTISDMKRSEGKLLDTLRSKT